MFGTVATGKLSRVPQTYLQIKLEIAKRLTELRRTVAHNLSPEEIAARAKEQGVSIGARTIRDYEKGVGEPSLEKLHAILAYYNLTLAEFFGFTAEDDDGKLIAQFKEAVRTPKGKKFFKAILSTYLDRN